MRSENDHPEMPDREAEIAVERPYVIVGKSTKGKFCFNCGEPLWPCDESVYAKGDLLGVDVRPDNDDTDGATVWLHKGCALFLSEELFRVVKEPSGASA